MGNENRFDDNGPYSKSGDSFQEFTDDRTPAGQPRRDFSLFQGESADEMLIEFICSDDDDDDDDFGDSVPA